jgi:hypothetical protein
MERLVDSPTASNVKPCEPSIHNPQLMMKTTEPSKFFIPLAKKGSIVDLYNQDWVVGNTLSWVNVIT